MYIPVSLSLPPSSSPVTVIITLMMRTCLYFLSIPSSWWWSFFVDPREGSCLLRRLDSLFSPVLCLWEKNLSPSLSFLHHLLPASLPRLPTHSIIFFSIFFFCLLPHDLSSSLVTVILIGTHQEQSAAFFWNIVRRTALQENPIVCWKFCHVLHKLLRDGHRKTIVDSYQFRGMIIDLGKMWGLLREGYGKLIQCYCTLLINKIDFLARNQRFPGNLQVSDAELDKIGESDVNVFFQLACEMFDYLDEILNLQKVIFGSLDMSRANSMTNAGQCRLAPLIPCIQDSSCLYDYCVKVLFKLHAVLPPGTLDGHRNRFFSQFKM